MADPVFRDPRLDALRNALYHTERRRFFDLLNKLINLVVIALGAAVAAKLAQLYHFNEIWLELSVVVVSALQLVFDFGGSARVQEFLQQKYYDALP